MNLWTEVWRWFYGPFECLVDDIKQNKVTSLKWEDKLDEAKARAISDALKENVSVVSVQIHGSTLEVKEARIIGEALGKSTALKRVYLSRCSVAVAAGLLQGESGDALISNKVVQSLQLDEMVVIGNFGVALRRFLQQNANLCEFGCSQMWLEPVRIKEIVGGITENMRYIDLGSCHLRDQGAELLFQGLKDNQTLTRIDVAANELTQLSGHIIGEWLKKNSSVTELNISYNSFGHIGAWGISEGLKCNRTLKRLFFSYTRLGPRGVRALVDGLTVNQSVTHLECDQSHSKYDANYDDDDDDVDDDVDSSNNSGEHIGTLLRLNHTITDLSVDGHEWQDEGMLLVANGLYANRTIRQLSLRRNKATHQGKQYVVDAIANNGTIIKVGGVKDFAREICQRNQERHHRVEMSVLTMLAMRRWRSCWNHVPKEIFQMLGKEMWKMKVLL